jgi:hypothetical protein
VNTTTVATLPQVSRPPTRVAPDEGTTVRGMVFGLLLALPVWALIAVLTLAVLSGA